MPRPGCASHGDIARLGCCRDVSPGGGVSARSRTHASFFADLRRGMIVVLALDQGTTGCAALVFDSDAHVIASADREIAQSYPEPGWVEHDPHEIFATTVAVAREALDRARVAAGDVAAIGITNQRETVMIWDRATGEPIYP